MSILYFLIFMFDVTWENRILQKTFVNNKNYFKYEYWLMGQFVSIVKKGCTFQQYNRKTHNLF